MEHNKKKTNIIYLLNKDVVSSKALQKRKGTKQLHYRLLIEYISYVFKSMHLVLTFITSTTFI